MINNDFKKINKTGKWIINYFDNLCLIIDSLCKTIIKLKPLETSS